jgi:integrase
VNFTDKKIQSLKAKSARYEVWEDGRTNLGLRVSTKGRKSWVYMYRFGGKARRMTLGTYPALSLADAHIAHAAAKNRLAMGEDPGSERVVENERRRGAETFDDLADAYLAEYAEPRKAARSVAGDRRMLDLDVRPAWTNRKARDISRDDVIAVIEVVLKRGAPVASNRTRALLHTIFNFAIRHRTKFKDFRDATHNPAALIDKEPEKARERFLSDGELAKFWIGVDQSNSIAPLVKAALKLLLVTGQRRSEVIGMAWSEIDDDNVWTLPSNRTKNRRAHLVPLSPLALSLVAEAKACNDDDAWVFRSMRRNGPITPQHITKMFISIRDGFGLGDVTVHDLRRTFVTGAARLGISRADRRLVVNHAENDAHAVYDQFEYLPEKRAALEKWAAHIKAVLAKAEDKGHSSIGDRS